MQDAQVKTSLWSIALYCASGDYSISLGEAVYGCAMDNT